MLKSLLRLAASTVSGGLFGLGLSLIPRPETVDVFWVSNLASPWLALAFLAGAWQHGRVWAAAAGILADVAATAAFYYRFLLIDPALVAGSPTPLMDRVQHNLSGWISFTLPWFGFAVAAGALYGLLGLWWHRRRLLTAGVLLGLPFLLEPWVWPLYVGHTQGPLVYWVVESAVGAALLAWVASRTVIRRRPRPAQG